MSVLTQNKYLTDSELKLLNSKLDNSRDSLLIKLALATGARASELLACKKSDISLVEDSYFILIKGIKGSNDRSIPLRPELALKLLQLNEVMFDFSYARLDQIFDKFKVNNKKFHSLRHTFAVELYKKTRDIKLVQLALGHKSITNTLVYAHLVDGNEKLKAALL